MIHHRLNFSLFGILLGVYGTKVVNEKIIRLVTALIILLCVISRAIALPIYLSQLGTIDFINPASYDTINTVSMYFLYCSGLSGVGVILFNVVRAYIKKRRVYATVITRS